MRILLPCPHHLRHLATDQMFSEWDKYVKTTLAKNNHLPLDERWLIKWYGWAGHVSRLPADRWANQMQLFRNVDWWRQQQSLETGFRHHQRRGNLSRWENILVRHHRDHHRWHQTARDRIEWAKGKEEFIDRVLGRENKHSRDTGNHGNGQGHPETRDMAPNTPSVNHPPGSALVPVTAVPPKSCKKAKRKLESRRPENSPDRPRKTARSRPEITQEELQAPLLDLVHTALPPGRHVRGTRLRSTHRAGARLSTAPSAAAAAAAASSRGAGTSRQSSSEHGSDAETLAPPTRQPGQAEASTDRFDIARKDHPAAPATAAWPAHTSLKTRASPKKRRHDSKAKSGSPLVPCTRHHRASSTSSRSHSSSYSHPHVQ